MTQHSKREIERKIEELDTEPNTPTLAEVWESDLRPGESYDLTPGEWAKLLK